MCIGFQERRREQKRHEEPGERKYHAVVPRGVCDENVSRIYMYAILFRSETIAGLDAEAYVQESPRLT